MSFARAVAFVLSREGGLVDDPLDPGGLTNKGIALNRHPELTADYIRHLTDAQAAQIYFNQYWVPIRGDVLPPYLHTMMLDISVLEGPASAIGLLQQALEVPVDTSFGPLTLHAVSVADEHDLIGRLAAKRIVSLASLPGWTHDGEGWAYRVSLTIVEAIS